MLFTQSLLALLHDLFPLTFPVKKASSCHYCLWESLLNAFLQGEKLQLAWFLKKSQSYNEIFFSMKAKFIRLMQPKSGRYNNLTSVEFHSSYLLYYSFNDKYCGFQQVLIFQSAIYISEDGSSNLCDLTTKSNQFKTRQATCFTWC